MCVCVSVCVFYFVLVCVYVDKGAAAAAGGSPYSFIFCRHRTRSASRNKQKRRNGVGPTGSGLLELCHRYQHTLVYKKTNKTKTVPAFPTVSGSANSSSMLDMSREHMGCTQTHTHTHTLQDSGPNGVYQRKKTLTLRDGAHTRLCLQIHTALTPGLCECIDVTLLRTKQNTLISLARIVSAPE